MGSCMLCGIFVLSISAIIPMRKRELVNFEVF